MTRQNKRINVTVMLSVLLLLWVVHHNSPPRINETTAEELVAFADQYWHTSSSVPIHIPESRWPTVIRRLRPQAVYVAEAGIFIRRGSLWVTEWGWFIQPSKQSELPEKDDPTYRLLKGRVYWYEIKG